MSSADPIVESIVRPLAEWLVRSSVSAALVVALVLILRRIAAPVLGARWRHALWFLVLLRLLLPAWPQSRMSMMHLTDAAGAVWTAAWSASHSPRTSAAPNPADRDDVAVRYSATFAICSPLLPALPPARKARRRPSSFSST